MSWREMTFPNINRMINILDDLDHNMRLE